jgi:hypothetical protein
MPLNRSKRLKRSPLPPRSKPLKRSTPIRKVNPEAKAKRVAKQRKHYASAEYKAARKEAMERAGNQCEWRFEDHPYLGVAVMYGRCESTEALEAHHLRYPKSRPLRSSDLEILCRCHHQLTEAFDHPTRHQR